MVGRAVNERCGRQSGEVDEGDGFVGGRHYETITGKGCMMSEIRERLVLRPNPLRQIR